MFRPFVVDLPINLWGRDIQTQMKLILTNDYSPLAKDILHKQGYVPGKGLGKYLQGQIEPLQTKQNPGRQGLGFS